MARTTAAAVKLVLAAGGDYDTENLPDLTPYIDAASMIVSRIDSCAVEKEIEYSDSDLETIERWIAAHAYAMSDQTYASKSTGGQSASFQGQTGMYLEATKYGQMALSLDYSGCLGLLGKPVIKASAVWLGKTVPERIDWEDRN